MNVSSHAKKGKVGPRPCRTIDRARRTGLVKVLSTCSKILMRAKISHSESLINNNFNSGNGWKLRYRSSACTYMHVLRTGTSLPGQRRGGLVLPPYPQLTRKALSGNLVDKHTENGVLDTIQYFAVLV